MKIMKTYNKIFRLMMTGLLVIFCSSKLHSQVNGFVVNCPGGVQNAGTTFQVNLSFNWTNSTTSATATLNYNPAVVSYDATCQSVLPACMAITNNPGTGVLTVTMANLSSCTNTNSISFNVCFRFNCPDTCAGVNKTATFNGTLTDNLSTTQTANCSATGTTPNNTTLMHFFHSYNSMTAEITYKVFYVDPTCFRIKNPKFVFTLGPGGCAGTITQAWGMNYTYTISGTTITPGTTVFNPYTWDTMYYVVKLPCTGCNGITHSSSVTWKGDNCNSPNSTINGPVTKTFTLPAAPAATPMATMSKAVYSSPNRFWTRITNTGNTPLNLLVTDFFPLVHLTTVTQYTNQTGISNTIRYFNCSTTPNGPYPLVGNGATNASAPANTSKYEWTINNLQPGNWVDLFTYFDLTSSCAGGPGPAPYKDSAVVTWNCAAPPGPCIPCGPGGQATGIAVYNPQPIISCVSSTYISQCKSVGDTLDFCFEFKNTGDAALLGGVFTVPLPNWLQYISGSATFTGFSPNPTYVALSNVKWNLPTIPVGNNVYKICFKAVINPGAVGGTNWFWTTATGSNINYPLYACYSTFNICAYAAIGIEKKVKGSLDGSFGNTGNGIAGSLVDYEITIKNTGTIPIDNLEVIDRFPSITPPDKFILANPTCPAFRGSQFDMLTGPLPVVASCTVSSSGDPNVCTGWPGVCLSCGPPAVGNWSGGNKAYKFKFNTSLVLAPGGTQTFYFQLKIPNNTAAGLLACNTAGFIAKTTAAYPGYTLNAVESNNVCVEVKETEVIPGGCCKDLLKKIKETHTVNNDVLNVNVDISAGPKKLKKVTVSLVQFEVKHPKDCDVCVKDPRLFGNIVPGNNTLPWTTTPPNVPFTHLISWQDSLGKDWSNGIPVNFSIPLPPRSPIACCCDTIYYCLRYVFTDTACVVCDTTICYKTYNGKDCKDGGGGNTDPVCACSFKPVFSYEGNGGHDTKDITCGQTMTLFKGNIYTTILPNFSCKDQNGNDCPAGNLTVTIKKPDNTVQTLAGPTYNFTFLAPGTYVYTISATCAGKKCECTFTVVIPQN
jgi:uncharacterized repeat protein (TIGR01451 family)